MKSRRCVTCTNYIENRGYPICARTIVHWTEWDRVVGERKRRTEYSSCSIERKYGIFFALFMKMLRGRALCTRHGLFWERNVQLLTSQAQVPALRDREQHLESLGRELKISPDTRATIGFAFWGALMTCAIVALVRLFLWSAGL